MPLLDSGQLKAKLLSSTALLATIVVQESKLSVKQVKSARKARQQRQQQPLALLVMKLDFSTINHVQLATHVQLQLLVLLLLLVSTRFRETMAQIQATARADFLVLKDLLVHTNKPVLLELFIRQERQLMFAQLVQPAHIATKAKRLFVNKVSSVTWQIMQHSTSNVRLELTLQ
jgi:hypothetical protein